MNKFIITIAAAEVALSLCAGVPVPQVSDVSMSQNAKGEAIIGYSLSAANAVITLDIQTNVTGGAWESIGGEAVSGARGDVWKAVETGSRSIKWDATTCWADHQIPASGIRAVVTAWALDNTPDYMVVDISDGAQQNTQTYYPSVDFLPGGILSNEYYRTTKLVMRKIMAKNVEWTMGSTALEAERGSNEATHQVALTNNYYIGVFEVTQSQWALIQSSRPKPSWFKNPDYWSMRPVECVSYNEIRNSANGTANAAYNWPADPNPSSFLGKLKTKTGIYFDLPSEAQWEFAARAGNGDMKWGDGSAIKNSGDDANLKRLARHYKNVATKSPGEQSDAQSATAIVGSYEPNDWGLYDTAGNVLEWCLDWYEAGITAHGGKVNIDPETPANNLSGTAGSNRVVRGGAYDKWPSYCRPARRDSFSPSAQNLANVGFRLVCTAGLQ